MKLIMIGQDIQQIMILASTTAAESSPAEMLNRFKTASHGYSLELESRSALRSLIRNLTLKEITTNSL